MAVPRRIDRLGPYELLEPIGEGGFARVYRVRRGGEELAAKVLSPAASAERTALERFQREIGVLSGIRHPNLIELVDSGVDEALGPYMVTRLVTGMTLRDLARGEPLCPEAALLL
ncbi:MAG TPA: protein kinase, partial [Sandaracinaceae bacterium]